MNMMQVKAFVAVARVSSFTHAAELLHVSQPALTVQVRQLEEFFNLKLFDRNTRRVRLTASGHDLFPILQNLLSEYESVVENARGIAGKRRGQITLGCLPSFATTHLPNMIVQFRKRNPQVAFAVKDSTGRRILAMVRAGDVEFGISDIDSAWPDLEFKELYRDRINIVFPKSHPLAKVKNVTLDEISHFPLVLLDAESNSRTVLDSAFIANGRLVTPACEVSYTSTAIGMVRAGLGITLLGSLVIEASNLHTFSELQFRPVPDPAFVRRVGLVRKKKQSLSPPAQIFADLLLENSRKNDWLTGKFESFEERD
jgi:DNA-binding transcriptional LysR family regulator